MAYSHIFANAASATGAQLDTDFNEAGLLGTIPCSVTGTNALTFIPAVNGPAPVLQTQLRVSGIAANTNTEAVTANAGFGALNVYKDGFSGPAALTGNEIIAGNYIVLAFDLALNSGAGGWHLQTPTVNAAGTVTQVSTGAGLTGGPVTTTGTIAFAAVADARLLANITGGSAVPSANSLTGILDAIMSSTQGAILQRGASVWTASVEQAWTPAIAFGGSSTGITYSTQVGRYYTIGYLIFAMYNLVLTSKGAQTGAATLSIPVAAGTSRVGSVIISNYANLGSVATHPFGNIAASGTTAQLYQAGAGTTTALAETDFANNTSMNGFLMYMTG